MNMWTYMQKKAEGARLLLVVTKQKIAGIGNPFHNESNRFPLNIRRREPKQTRNVPVPLFINFSLLGDLAPALALAPSGGFCSCSCCYSCSCS